MILSLIEKIKKYIAPHCNTIIIYILYICFEPMWVSLFGQYITDPILSKFASNWLTDTIFLATILYTISFYITDFGKKRVSKQSISIAIAIFCLYLYYRIDTPLSISLNCTNIFSYVDIIPLITLYYPIIGLSYGKPREEQIATKANLIDNPIKNKSEDELNRNHLAEIEAEKLVNSSTLDGAFTLGIVAPWGEGKSSFMKMMKQYIDNQGNKHYITLEFNPWLYRNSSNLTHIFFDQLANELQPYSSNIAKWIIKYGDILSSVDNGMLKSISKIISLSSNNSTEEIFKEIRTKIRNLNKKILIFIDDIDRLNCKEIEEIFRLVRNTSNFPNLYFVLSYDKVYVVNTLKSEFGDYNLSYTDKILQKEYTIPKMTTKQLNEKFKSLVNNEFEKINNDQINDIISINITSYLNNIRDIKRFINTTSTCYESLEGNVKFYDLAIYKLLGMKYPYIIRLIEDRYDNIIATNQGPLKNNLIVNHKNNYPEDVTTYETEPIFNLIEYINNEANRLTLNPKDIFDIKILLELLWGEDRSPDRLNINNALYLKRYIYQTLPYDEISECEFKEFLTIEFDKMKPYLIEWGKVKSNFFIKRFKIEFYQNNKDVEFNRYIINILFYFNSHSQDYKFEHSYIQRFIENLYIADSSGYREEDIDMIKELLINNNNLSYALDYLKHIQETARDIIHHIIDFDTQTKIQEHLFLKYANLNGNKVRDTIKIWEKSIPLRNNKLQFIASCNNKMREIAESNIIDFIPLTIGYNKSLFFSKIEAIWLNRDNFYNYIDKLENNNEIINEYKAYVDCVKNNDGHEIEFPFRYIILDA